MKEAEEPYTDFDARLAGAMVQAAALMLENLRLKGQGIDEQRVRRDVLARLDPGMVSVLKECPECGSCFDADAERCVRDGSEVFGQASALRRFRREAQTVARLDHPNIVAVYDFGELDGGAAYLVMERLRGSTLRSVMTGVGAFRPVDAADWFEGMLDGLAAAHESGVVHRDLKPENVVGIRRAGAAFVVKILDFGLAKMRPGAAAARPSDTLTRSGFVFSVPPLGLSQRSSAP